MEGSNVGLVSGGTRGLGAAIVADLLAHGWSVATFGRTDTPFVATAREQHRDRFWFAPVDAADGAAVTRFAGEAIARFKRIDVLVNNAGIGIEGVLSLTQLGAIHQALAVNLEAALLLAREVSKVMLRQRSGHIVNISSVNGIAGNRGMAVYSATKAGLDGMTRSLARELGSRGIRVNSIAPGYLATEMTHGMQDAQLQQIMRRTPLGRLGTVDDVVGLLRYLLSPAASFITGQTLVIDGGLTC